MKKMFGESSSNNLLRSVITGTVVGLVVTVCILLISAVIMSAGALSNATAKYFTYFTLLAASFTGGFVTAKRAVSKVLLSSLLTGVFLYLLIAVISAAVTKSGFSSAFISAATFCSTFGSTFRSTLFTTGSTGISVFAVEFDLFCPVIFF